MGTTKQTIDNACFGNYLHPLNTIGSIEKIDP